MLVHGGARSCHDFAPPRGVAGATRMGHSPRFSKSGSCPNLEPPGLRRGQPAACARKGRSRALAGAARIGGLGWRPGGVKRGGQAALAAATSQ
jgi:hypothetical protein